MIDSAQVQPKFVDSGILQLVLKELVESYTEFSPLLLILFDPFWWFSFKKRGPARVLTRKSNVECVWGFGLGFRCWVFHPFPSQHSNHSITSIILGSERSDVSQGRKASLSGLNSALYSLASM